MSNSTVFMLGASLRRQFEDSWKKGFEVKGIQPGPMSSLRREYEAEA